MQYKQLMNKGQNLHPLQYKQLMNKGHNLDPLQYKQLVKGREGGREGGAEVRLSTIQVAVIIYLSFSCQGVKSLFCIYLSPDRAFKAYSVSIFLLTVR